MKNNTKKHHTVGTIQKNTTQSEQFKKTPHSRNNSKKHHTVGTIPNSNIKIIEPEANLIPLAHIHT
jgi:GMP synthase PP-ATPase subunit